MKSRRKTIIAYMIAMALSLGFFNFLIGPVSMNVSAAADIHTWDGGGANALASTKENWDTDIAPTAGDMLIFNAGALPCTFDIADTFGDIYLNATYTGVVTQSVAFGYASFVIASGTWTGITGTTQTCSGNWAKTGGTITNNVLNLTMTGTSKTVSSTATVYFYHLIVSGTVTLTTSEFKPYILTVSGTLTTEPYLTVRMDSAISGIHNTGTIVVSPGSQLKILIGTMITSSTAFGSITGQVSIIKASTTSPTSYFELKENTTLQTLAVSTLDATYGCQVNATSSNYKLTITTAFTLGTKCSMLQGSGLWTFTNYSQTASSTTYSQNGPMNVASFYMTDGIFNGNILYPLTDSGNFVKTGGTITNNLLSLYMTGASKTVRSNAVLYPYELRIGNRIEYPAISSEVKPYRLVIDAGGNLRANTSMTIRLDTPSCGLMNSGTIWGDSLRFSISTYNGTTALHGLIDCDILFYLHSSSTANMTAGLSGAANLMHSLAFTSENTSNHLLFYTNDYAISARQLALYVNAVVYLASSNVRVQKSIYISSTSGLFAENARVQVNNSWLSDSATFDSGASLVYLPPPTTNFYASSQYWQPYVATDAHGFDIVHDSKILEVNKLVDGTIRKYLAYESNAGGTEIHMFYSDMINGTWVAYSGNPILGPTSNRYRCPTVAYVNGTFQLFNERIGTYQVERFSSSDGITFTLQETVITSPYSSTLNPFIWQDPNDSQWYLFWRQLVDGYYQINARHSTYLENLDGASDTTVINESYLVASNAWPTISYFDGRYILLWEYGDFSRPMWDGATFRTPVWCIKGAYSTTSPISGYVNFSDNPLFERSEACPKLFVGPTGDRYFLFTNWGFSGVVWYQYAREIYLGDSNGRLGDGQEVSLVFTPTFTGPTLTISIEDSPTNQSFDFHISDWSPSLFKWNFSSDGSTLDITFTLSALEDGRMYRLYVDGSPSHLMTAVDGAISFTYSGPWSEHQFEIVQTSITGQISGLVNLIFIMFAVGIVVSVIVESTKSLRKKESLTTEQMVKSLFSMMIYIVIGMASLGVIYSVIA